MWEGLADWKCWLGPEVRASQTRLGPLFCGSWGGTGSRPPAQTRASSLRPVESHRQVFKGISSVFTKCVSPFSRWWALTVYWWWCLEWAGREASYLGIHCNRREVQGIRSRQRADRDTYENFRHFRHLFFSPQKRKETKASYKFHYTVCKCVSTLLICLKKSGNTPASYKHIQFLSKGRRKIDTVGCRTWRKTGKRLESFFYLCHTEPHKNIYFPPYFQPRK